MKGFFKGVILTLIVLVLVGVAFYINVELGVILLNIVSFFLILYFTLWILRQMERLFTWLEVNDLVKPRKQKNLYQWMSLEFDEKFLFDLFHSKYATNELDNLREIKRVLKIRIGRNLSDYYLLKSYLEWNRKNSVLNNIGLLTTTIVTSFITSFLTQGVLFNKINLLLIMDGKLAEKITSVLKYSSITIAILVIILVFYSEFTKNKRKLEFTSIIIDEIIREKEQRTN
ncbi:hypothetical protein [Viridibacillus arvi]|uniref:hypothetical protein n=1 Tax=Viridibacillus arvi TaxID=263475 RepID=UPI00187B15F9|nr:hypothetical protein [Viridibacillus sp. JNUCC-6]QOV10921.1 hypothetical protein JNUCC6_20520 [Viridibacillus sp. JNUCC-6]